MERWCRRRRCTRSGHFVFDLKAGNVWRQRSTMAITLSLVMTGRGARGADDFGHVIPTVHVVQTLTIERRDDLAPPAITRCCDASVIRSVRNNLRFLKRPAGVQARLGARGGARSAGRLARQHIGPGKAASAPAREYRPFVFWRMERAGLIRPTPAAVAALCQRHSLSPSWGCCGPLLLAEIFMRQGGQQAVRVGRRHLLALQIGNVERIAGAAAPHG